MNSSCATPVFRANDARRRLLRMHFESGVGHIGGNLSCLDLLTTLFVNCLYEQDRFVLSKGHAAGALYVALWMSGRLEEAALATFHRDGTLLAGHPCSHWHPDIPFATGSLGHGISLAAGLAHAMRLRGESGTVFCLASDGELNEGSVWEALHYAAHHALSNLVIMIDSNGLQGFGRTDDVMALPALSSRLVASGLLVETIDGHSHVDVARALSPTRHGETAPRVVIAQTIKGKGISFMENRMEWHYLPLTEALYTQALAELEPVATRVVKPSQIEVR